MPQCQGITRDEQQCRRTAVVGRRYCFQHDRRAVDGIEEHHRGCTETIDPITLEPLGDDVIRIETAPLRDGSPGPIHCFNADSITRYITLNRGAYPNITNPLTGAVIPQVQLDAIMRRLNIEMPDVDNRVRDMVNTLVFNVTGHMTDAQLRLDYRRLYSRAEHLISQITDNHYRDLFTAQIININRRFDEGANIRGEYTNLSMIVSRLE